MGRRLGPRFCGGKAEGTTSGTTDGGATWFDANDVGRFINRFRFTGTKPIVGYASGGTIYKCVEAAGDALARLTPRRACERRKFPTRGKRST